jgi:transposase
MATDRHYLLAVLKNYHPDLVVIESCGLAGWVHDICSEEGYEVLVCNPNQEAWKWKHIKRKTDRDDALKLAKLAAPGQLVPVYIPCRQQREYRRLVKYRQVVLGRIECRTTSAPSLPNGEWRWCVVRRHGHWNVWS